MASARNRRLAQQMENRPSVQAALHHKQVRQGDPAQLVFLQFLTFSTVLEETVQVPSLGPSSPVHFEEESGKDELREPNGETSEAL